MKGFEKDNQSVDNWYDRKMDNVKKKSLQSDKWRTFRGKLSRDLNIGLEH